LKLAKPEQLGAFGEAIWSKVLASSGWTYISLTKICEGGAPMARGRGGNNLILPDLSAFKDGRSVFVEAKAKTQSIVYRNRKQERHGIDQKNYEHYRQVQYGTGRPCCIGLVELWRESREDQSLYWSGSLLFEKLNDLLDPRSEHPETPRKVYWPRDSFPELISGCEPRELFQLANGEMQLNFEYELQHILYPAKQQNLFA